VGRALGLGTSDRAARARAGSGARRTTGRALVAVTLLGATVALATPAGAVAPTRAAQGVPVQTPPDPPTTDTTTTTTPPDTTPPTTAPPDTTPTTAPATPPDTTPPVTTPPVTTPDTVPPPATNLLGSTLANNGGFDPDVLVPPSRSLAADSLARAAALLTRLQLYRVDLANQRLAQLTAIDNAGAETVKTQTLREQAKRARVARALQMYRGTSDAEQVLPVAQTLEQQRQMMLITDADISTRKQIVDLGHHLRDLKNIVTTANQKIGDLDTQAYVLGLEIAQVQEKIAGIGAAGAQLPAGPGPDAAAAYARKVQALLDTAPSTPDPNSSTAYRAARHTLATLVATEAGRVSPDALDAEWAKMGRATMRALLFAMSQVGKPYVYATAGPDTYDCSGLTMRAWAEAGLGLQHFSGAQLAEGAPVPPISLQPGDLLTYGPLGADHVTMYLGQGLVVEAKGHAYGVVIDRARTDGDFAGASRVAPPNAPSEIPQP
jgi:cell wall-associated NlpC family hydrolase